MRKATKRMEEESVEGTKDSSPPKKSKVREKKVPAISASTRLPRAAKTKAAAAQLNNNVEIETTVETAKKSRVRAKPAMQKSNSSDGIASKTSETLKKSKSAEDIDQQGVPAPKKIRNVAAKKHVGKKAAMEGKAKPKVKAATGVEPEEHEEESEEEQPHMIAKKGYSGAAGARKIAAPKKNTRGRGKPAPVDDAGEETGEAVEEVKTVKGKKNGSKMNGKKATPVEDPEEEDEADKEGAEDVVEEAPEDMEEAAKPKKGKKGGVPMKKGRGKKATASIEPDEKINEENGEDHNVNAHEDVEELKKESKPVKGRKGKAPAARNRGKKAAPKAKEDNEDKEAVDEEDIKEHSGNGTEPQEEEEADKDKGEPAENGKDDSINDKNRIR